jgi:hypothetical protein
MADTKEQIQYDKDLARLNAVPSGYARTQLKKEFDAKYPDGRPATPTPELTQEEKDAAAAKAAEEAAAAETKRKKEAAALDFAAKGVDYVFKYPTRLSAEEVTALSPEERVIYDTERNYTNTLYRDDPAKFNADNAIRAKAKAEGRNLTREEFDKLNYQTIQDRLFGLQGFKPGTPQNPFATGGAAVKKPFNMDEWNYRFYQDYLAGHNGRDVTLFGGGKAEPMSLEEFTRVFEAIGGQPRLIEMSQGGYGGSGLSQFSKGQEELAIRTRGRAIPGMDTMLDPRANYTADDIINSYMSQNPDDPMNLFSDIDAGGYGADGGYGTATGGGTGGQYTTMGTSTGSSANIRNPYKVGTQQYEDFKDRKSAYDLLYSEFKQYGLESLVEPLKGLITSGVSKDEFTLRLRETEPYKKRFAANEIRIKNGLRALSEFDYIQNEDLYQEVMRRRGLPPEYYAKGDLGVQKGFESLLAGDVSSTELEDRIVTAQDRVLNANPEVAATLKEFYPGISNGDILAYTLDPANAINAIKRKITAAEIGGAAAQSGLQTNVARAEELTAAGINKAAAEEGFGKIGGGLQRGSQLASIYGESPYDQTTAEQEVFGLAGKVGATQQRQKLVKLERSTFGGQSGLTSGALARDRAGGY